MSIQRVSIDIVGLKFSKIKGRPVTLLWYGKRISTKENLHFLNEDERREKFTSVTPTRAGGFFFCAKTAELHFLERV